MRLQFTPSTATPPTAAQRQGYAKIATCRLESKSFVIGGFSAGDVLELAGKVSEEPQIHKAILLINSGLGEGERAIGLIQQGGGYPYLRTLAHPNGNSTEGFTLPTLSFQLKKLPELTQQLLGQLTLGVGAITHPNSVPYQAVVRHLINDLLTSQNIALPENVPYQTCLNFLRQRVEDAVPSLRWEACNEISNSNIVIPLG
jgi:hypothetical protein